MIEKPFSYLKWALQQWLSRHICKFSQFSILCLTFPIIYSFLLMWNSKLFLLIKRELHMKHLVSNMCLVSPRLYPLAVIRECQILSSHEFKKLRVQRVGYVMVQIWLLTSKVSIARYFSQSVSITFKLLSFTYIAHSTKVWCFPLKRFFPPTYFLKLFRNVLSGFHDPLCFIGML